MSATACAVVVVALTGSLALTAAGQHATTSRNQVLLTYVGGGTHEQVVLPDGRAERSVRFPYVYTVEATGLVEFWFLRGAEGPSDRCGGTALREVDHPDRGLFGRHGSFTLQASDATELRRVVSATTSQQLEASRRDGCAEPRCAVAHETIFFRQGNSFQRFSDFMFVPPDTPILRRIASIAQLVNAERTANHGTPIPSLEVHRAWVTAARGDDPR